MISKYLIPLIIYVFLFVKIIPRVYKISESINQKEKLVSETAKILSSDSNLSILDLKGFTGFYAHLINKLLDHPAKVLLSAIAILIAVQYS